MKKKRNILILIISWIFLIFIPNQIVYADITEEQQEFINLIIDEAINGYKEFNILPSLTIAQAILESSWGESSLAKEANNLFGIKAYDDWDGACYTISTKEYCSQGYIYINADFKAYSSITESIKDHNLLLSTDRYEEVRSATNYFEACEAIYNCGYATSPTYTETLLKIIENFNLYEYDTVEEVSIDEASGTVLNDPIIETALNKNFENNIIFSNLNIITTTNNTSSSENKEDTNNIPTEIANIVFTNHNYWYVIYCLLQNVYPNTVT